MKCENCGDKWFDLEVIQRGVCPTCGKSLTVKEEGSGTTPDIKFKRPCKNCGRLIETGTSTPGPCPYCGADYQADLPPPTDHWLEDAVGETGATVQLEAQVSTAVNTRRIALSLILAIFLSIGTALVFLAIAVFYPGDVHDARNLLTIWIAVAVFVMTGGSFLILFDSRLTRL